MKFDNTGFDYTASDAADKPVTPGDYTAMVTDETDLVETASGGAGIKVKMRLVDGPDGAVSRPMTDTVGYSAAAAWKVAQLADSAGVARPTEISEASARAFIAALRGQEIRVKVKSDTFTRDGVTKNTYKIDKYLSQASASATPITAAAGRRHR